MNVYINVLLFHTQFLVSTLSILRRLQSEFTTHRELNRVKNIFRDCRPILLNNEKIDVKQWSTKLSIRLAKTIYLSEDLLHAHSTKWIVHIDYRMRSNIDALIVITLILLMWWNCLSHDIIDLKFSKILNCLLTNCRRSYSRKTVWIDHLSKNSLRWCSIECNVHINSRICRSINALIVVAMILLTWSNCSFHCIIDLMLQLLISSSMSSSTFSTSWLQINSFIDCNDLDFKYFA